VLLNNLKGQGLHIFFLHEQLYSKFYLILKMLPKKKGRNK
jgi:hypothetical protein